MISQAVLRIPMNQPVIFGVLELALLSTATVKNCNFFRDPRIPATASRWVAFVPIAVGRILLMSMEMIQRPGS